MKNLKRFNEIVGFDDEDTRDRLEIPNLRGELDPGSPSMRQFYKPVVVGDTVSELKKVFFNFPILEVFHTNKQKIDDVDLISLYATSKNEEKGDFYCQLSFAFKGSEYHIGTIFRERENVENEDEWIINNFRLDNIKDVFEVSKAFVEVCQKLGIFDENDLSSYKSYLN
jgi:hypothetical protein